MFKSPLVVGYKGEIGSFILNGLLKRMPKALDIWCFDINETEEEKIERIKKSDVIFLCVPMQNTIEWVVKYSHLLNGKAIIEQCSLKEFISEEISRRFPNRKFTVLSMHILFRPSVTPRKEDRKVIFNDHPLWYLYREDVEKIVDANDGVTLLSYTEHDMIMAYNQALVHKTLLVLRKLLIDDSTYNGMYSTYISKRIIELAERITQGDKTLYALIQNNKFTEKATRIFNDELQKFNINDFEFEKET